MLLLKTILPQIGGLWLMGGGEWRAARRRVCAAASDLILDALMDHVGTAVDSHGGAVLSYDRAFLRSADDRDDVDAEPLADLDRARAEGANRTRHDRVSGRCPGG
jgi:hypothetical protein